MTNWFRKLIGRPRDGRKALLKRVQQKPYSQDALVLHDLPGVVKMSAVILDFAQPWLAEARDDEDTQDIVSAAVLAWNLSLLPPSECEQQFQELLVRKLDRPQRIMMRKMITRRRTDFARHHRLVVDYVLKLSDHELHLDVMTTL